MIEEALRPSTPTLIIPHCFRRLSTSPVPVKQSENPRLDFLSFQKTENGKQIIELEGQKKMVLLSIDQMLSQGNKETRLNNLKLSVETLDQL